MSDAQTPKKEVTEALVQKHYTAMSTAIMVAIARSGMPIEVAVARAVSLFGLKPTADNKMIYEIVPSLRAKLDAAADEMGEPRLPIQFTEDQAVMFCAVQTATLEVEGKLGELADDLRAKNAELDKKIAEAKAKSSTPAVDKGRIAPVGDNVVPFPGKAEQGFDDDEGGNGPTYH